MPDSSPLITVVVPAFNAEETLGESLRSLGAQDFADFEVIVVDDGSTDGSAAIADAYCRGDSRFRLIRSAHVGVVEAARRGCAEARGTYIARMDADDEAHEMRLRKQLAYLEERPEVALCGSQVEMIGDGIGSGRRRYEDWLNALETHEAIEREMFVECAVANPAMMIRREAFESVGGYEDRAWAEDYDLILRCSCAGMRMGNVPEKLLRWRHSAGRLSMNDPRYSLENFRRIKRHYLFVKYPVGERRFFQWGAGEVGKNWLREWEGLRPEAAVDLHPRKIGKEIHETLVIAPEELPGPGEALTVVAVGAPGAREEIRGWFGARGYEELKDYLFLA